MAKRGLQEERRETQKFSIKWYQSPEDVSQTHLPSPGQMNDIIPTESAASNAIESPLGNLWIHASKNQVWVEDYTAVQAFLSVTLPRSAGSVTVRGIRPEGFPGTALELDSVESNWCYECCCTLRTHFEPQLFSLQLIHRQLMSHLFTSLPGWWTQPGSLRGALWNVTWRTLAKLHFCCSAFREEYRRYMKLRHRHLLLLGLQTAHLDSGCLDSKA